MGANVGTTPTTLSVNVQNTYHTVASVNTNALRFAKGCTTTADTNAGIGGTGKKMMAWCWRNPFADVQVGDVVTFGSLNVAANNKAFTVEERSDFHLKFTEVPTESAADSGD